MPDVGNGGPFERWWDREGLRLAGTAGVQSLELARRAWDEGAAAMFDGWIGAMEDVADDMKRLREQRGMLPAERP